MDIPRVLLQKADEITENLKIKYPELAPFFKGCFLNTMENPMKSEFYIPTVIDNMIHRHNYNIKVLECAEKWYGVTYKEDKATVAAAMKEKTERGLYNGI